MEDMDTPEPIEDFEAVIERFFEGEEEIAASWRKHSQAIRELLSKEELYVMPANRSCPVLLRKPEFMAYREHQMALKVIQRGNKGPREKVQAELNEGMNYASSHCAYPSNSELKRIASSINYDIFEQINVLLDRLTQDDILGDIVKLAKL